MRAGHQGDIESSRVDPVGIVGVVLRHVLGGDQILAAF